METWRFYKDQYGRVWKRFAQSPWVENDEVGKGGWYLGKGLVEIDDKVIGAR